MFRRATEFDVLAITALINVAYEVENFFKIGDRTDAAEVAALLGESAFLVHEEEDEIVGCVHVLVRGERGYFGLLAVHPKKRGQNLGKRLVAAAEGFCRDAGCRAMDLLQCIKCGSRMKLLALVADSKSVARYLRAIGEPTDTPGRSPSRGLPYWKSTVLRRKALHDVA